MTPLYPAGVYAPLPRFSKKTQTNIAPSATRSTASARSREVPIITVALSSKELPLDTRQRVSWDHVLLPKEIHFRQSDDFVARAAQAASSLRGWRAAPGARDLYVAATKRTISSAAQAGLSSPSTSMAALIKASKTFPFSFTPPSVALRR